MARPRAALGSVQLMGTEQTRAVVEGFLRTVRSGAAPERAGEFLADVVLAHQVQAEAPDDVAVERTPQGYADHVREMLAAWGPFTFRLDVVLADGDLGYARWTQDGHHVGEVDGRAPTGRPMREVASAVYRVADGRIREYWIQIDRLGVLNQLSP